MRLASLNARTPFVAVALMVASPFSAGLSHAHPGGNLAHHHYAGQISPDRVVSTAPSALGNIASERLQWSAAQSHTHVYVLGFEFTVPAEDQPRDDSSRGTDLIVTRLAIDDFDVSQASPTIDWLLVPAVAILPALPADTSSDCALTAIALESSPLCDSARHERSGVLRI